MKKFTLAAGHESVAHGTTGLVRRAYAGENLKPSFHFSGRRKVIPARALHEFAT